MRFVNFFTRCWKRKLREISSYKKKNPYTRATAILYTPKILNPWEWRNFRKAFTKGNLKFSVSKLSRELRTEKNNAKDINKLKRNSKCRACKETERFLFIHNYLPDKEEFRDASELLYHPLGNLVVQVENAESYSALFLPAQAKARYVYVCFSQD